MKMKMKIGDFVIIAIIVAISVAIFIYSGNRINKKAVSKSVSIQINGKEIEQIEFSDELIGTTKEIKTEYGYNLLEFGDGKVRSIEADCPDQIDVLQGYISEVGETIVCLPNRMVVEIIDDVDVDDVDLVN